MTSERVYTVSEITRRVKRLIDVDDELQNIWLRGEISNFKWHQSSGHMYFTVKDEKAKIQAVMFRGYNRHLIFQPEDGMSVLIYGSVSVYEASGQYQFYCYEMEPDGVGSLFLAFEQLKEKLSKEGLFSQDYKKELPKYPTKIAIVTSPTGAAIRDIVTTIRRRFPIASISLIPALVQGEGAARSIARAIRYANELNRFDVLIVGRGGGSIEELWAFNEEEVARAVFASKIPVISAVGHETDFTICDFVADVRAATPTAAAEICVPDKTELLKQVQNFKLRAIRALAVLIRQKKETLTRYEKSYAFRYPEQLLRQKEQELDERYDELVKTMKRLIEKKRHQWQLAIIHLQKQRPDHFIDSWRKQLQNETMLLKKHFQQLEKEKKHQFQQLLAKLQALSPLKIMERGYSLSFNENKSLIKSIHDVNIGEKMTVRLRDGSLLCTVHEKNDQEIGDMGE